MNLSFYNFIREIQNLNNVQTYKITKPILTYFLVQGTGFISNREKILNTRSNFAHLKFLNGQRVARLSSKE